MCLRCRSCRTTRCSRHSRRILPIKRSKCFLINSAALPSPILRRLSSTSNSGATPRPAGLQAAPALPPWRAGRPASARGEAGRRWGGAPRRWGASWPAPWRRSSPRPTWYGSMASAAWWGPWCSTATCRPAGADPASLCQRGAPSGHHGTGPDRHGSQSPCAPRAGARLGARSRTARRGADRLPSWMRARS